MFKISTLPKHLKWFVLVASVFALANISYMFFNIFYTIFAVPFGILSDKIGKKPTILSGYALFALTAILPGNMIAGFYGKSIPILRFFTGQQ